MRKSLCMLGVAVVMALGGCGGGGNSNYISPYAGNWGGSFFVSGNPTEQMNLSIANNGSITGTETVGSATTADTGSVKDNGDFSIRSRLAGTPDATLIGNMFVGNDGLLHGDGTETQSGSGSFTFSFDLNPI
ncbi:MAG: hypothetical protein ACYC96_04845 [Fimbriimonadaceae bacterium]